MDDFESKKLYVVVTGINASFRRNDVKPC